MGFLPGSLALVDLGFTLNSRFDVMALLVCTLSGTLMNERKTRADRMSNLSRFALIIRIVSPKHIKADSIKNTVKEYTLIKVGFIFLVISKLVSVNTS